MSLKETRILSTINELEDYLHKLDEARSYTREQVRDDWNIRFSVERALQLAMECAVELGEDVISIAKYKKPETYRETFEILGREGILSQELAGHFGSLVELRNKLVHVYPSVSFERVYAVSKEGTEKFREFVAAMREFLQDRGQRKIDAKV